MIPAVIDTVAAELTCGPGNIFRATGSTVTIPGFMEVYREGKDDKAALESDERLLPPLEQGEEVDIVALRAEQHFTEPPPRYTEASLVRALEEFGIGRPSTYASIISTLREREYVDMDKRRFVPTDVGRIVNKFLTQHFNKYVDYQFTARLEDALDEVSRGEKDWIPLMREFWTPFKALVNEKDESVKRSDVVQEALQEACPKCGKPLALKLGRNGRFIGCTGYPECDYTRDLTAGEPKAAPEVVDGRRCPECEAPLIVRNGRYGKFIGCSAYPKCRYIEPLEKPLDTAVSCPKCRKGTLLQRKSRKGKIFFSCSTYPKCDYAVWDPPLGEPCPKCGWPVLTLKTSKREGARRTCPQKACGYSEPYDEDAAERRAAAADHTV